MQAQHDTQIRLTFKQLLFFARALVLVAILALVGEVLLGQVATSYGGYAWYPIPHMPAPLALSRLLLRTASYALPVMAFAAVLIAYAPRRSRAHFWAIVLLGGAALIGVTFIWELSFQILPDVHFSRVMDYNSFIYLLTLFYGPYLFFDGALLVLSLEPWDWLQRTRAMKQLALADDLSVEPLPPRE
jgi:hypothetical protein